MVTLTASLPPSRLGSYPRIEILGVFGSGKTTLARQLADNQGSLLLEQHEHNIYWQSPNANAVAGFLAYELSFLLQHHYLAASQLASTDASVGICDWSFESDQLWACMRLSKEDLHIYESVHRKLVGSLEPPIAYVYLCPSIETITARLKLRNRAGEKFEISELTQAAKSLEEMVHALPSAKVIRMDDEINIVDVQSQFQFWLKRAKNAC